MPLDASSLDAPQVTGPMRSWSIDTLFVCLLRYRRVRQEAVQHLESRHLDRADERGLALLWDLVLELHPQYDRERIPFKVLVNQALDLAIPRSEFHAAPLRIPLEPLWAALWRVVKPTGVVVLHATNPYAAELVVSQPKFFREDLVWSKTRAANYASAKRRHMKLHELILVFSRTPAYTYHPQKPRTNTAYGGFDRVDDRPNAPVSDRYPGTIRHHKSPRQQDVIHPTPKPVELEEHLIRSYSNPGAMVLDPCFGSNATGKAARAAGREFTGIEGDERYYQAAAQEALLVKLGLLSAGASA